MTTTTTPALAQSFASSYSMYRTVRGSRSVRALIHRAFIASGIEGTIEEVVGDHPSPTVLVNGVDVTGRSYESGAACRLDLPTDVQLGDALTSAAFNVASPP